MVKVSLTYKRDYPILPSNESKFLSKKEINYLESLGLFETGQGGKLVEDRVTTITGKHPINTSGGLISMGHPVGPTGIGQVAEIIWQMRRQ